MQQSLLKVILLFYLKIYLKKKENKYTTRGIWIKSVKIYIRIIKDVKQLYIWLLLLLQAKDLANFLHCLHWWVKLFHLGAQAYNLGAPINAF